MIGRAALFLIALGSILTCCIAHAQEGTASVVIVAGPREAREVDLEQVRGALERDLGVSVGLGGPRERAPSTVVVRVTGRARVILILRRDDGARMQRAADLPETPEERAAMVAILAGNLVRDEASELLELLRAAQQPALETPSEPTSTEETAPLEAEVAAEPATPPSEEGAAGESSSASPSTAGDTASDPTNLSTSGESMAAPEAAAPTAPPPVEVEPSEPPGPRARLFRIGVDVQVGSVPSGADEIEATVFGGLQLGLILTPWLAIGVRDVAGGVAGALERPHFEATPFAELGWRFAGPEIALYGQGGLELQGYVEESRVAGPGVAPLVVLGARWYAADWFSIGIESVVRVVATDVLFSHLQPLPQGAIVWTGGLSFLLHL